MTADKRFTNQPLEFWANVRFLSQQCGYTDPAKKAKKATSRKPAVAAKPASIKKISIEEIVEEYREQEFNLEKVINDSGEPTEFGQLLVDYFECRAEMLATHAEKNLLTAAKAKALFEELQVKHNPKCPIPYNKQSGDKKVSNYMTGIVNILVEASSQGYKVDYDPRKLTTITKDLAPARTLSRRIDGAFPSTVNPIAIWEIKEYYYTTTFGSKISDGVYETQLDGWELQEARISLDFDTHHYLMVDAYDTWWGMGKSYLCRMCDMLHMGTTSEIFFGKEVVERIPKIVPLWIKKLEARTKEDV
jgi:hypothetical protein